MMVIFDTLPEYYEYYEAPAADAQTKCYVDYAAHVERERMNLNRLYPTPVSYTR